jgi:L-ascorbate metabolism protein UlaG (beta-lactamase superfamily)
MHSAHFKDGRFVNTPPVRGLSSGDFVKMLWRFFFGRRDGRVPAHELPVVRPEKFREPASSAIQYIWLGHSSILLEIEGKRLLLDPVFSRRASFSRFVGPKRFHPAPLSLEELPHIDMVLISHNHYDHLDRLVVDHFKGSQVRFLVPLGVRALLLKWGVGSERVTELDWWEDYVFDGLTVVSTPARHFSGRGLCDRDETLWTSWAILGEHHRVFFSGDTGMTPRFTDIGERYGPFDITFIKMAAYDQMWPDIHLTPEEAVRAHIMLRGARLVPIHWGTFALAFHPWREPIERLVRAAAENGVSILTSKIGETVVPAEHENSFWWREVDGESGRTTHIQPTKERSP